MIYGKEITFLKALNLSKRDIPFLIFLFTLYFSFYSAFSYYVFSSDSFPDRIIAYSEKARLAVEGFPPRLENTGFVYPLIPIISSCSSLYFPF